MKGWVGLFRLSKAVPGPWLAALALAALCSGASGARGADWSAWDGVEAFRGYYTSVRTSEVNLDLPYHIERVRSELAGSVAFELQRNKEGGWGLVHSKAHGTWKLHMFEQNSAWDPMKVEENGSFSGPVRGEDIRFELNARTGTWMLSFGGRLEQPYTITRSIFRRYNNMSRKEETLNETGESRSYPHAVFLRSALPGVKPGALYGKSEREDTIKREGRVSRMSARVSLIPVYRDLEVVVRVHGADEPAKETPYAEWLPRGAATAEIPGGRLKVRARLQARDGRPVKARVKQFRFELRDTSREPGVAMNWPPLKLSGPLASEQVPPDPEFDLRFDGRTGAIDAKKQVQRVPPSNGPHGEPSAEAGIECFDFGAWADLVVVAELADGREITGHLEKEPEKVVIPLPKRTGGSHIADAWKERGKVQVHVGDEADDEREPAGEPGFDGDGLTLYEEYRGFMVKGEHKRTDPGKKTLFVHSTEAHLTAGIDLFRAASGLEVYEVKETELYKDPKIAPSPRCDIDRTLNPYVINFNKGVHHQVDQHALWVTKVRLDGAAGQSCIGPPKFVPRVEIQKHPGPEGAFMEPHIVAHELGHAVGMPHHGRGDYNCEENADCKTTYGVIGIGLVAVQHGQHSGCDQGLMRYIHARFIERIEGGKKQFPLYCWGPDLWCRETETLRQTLFCRSDKGTGVNAPDPKAKNPIFPKAGDATPGCGNSLGYIRISDRYDTRRLQLIGKGCI